MPLLWLSTLTFLAAVLLLATSIVSFRRQQRRGKGPPGKAPQARPTHGAPHRVHVVPSRLTWSDSVLVEDWTAELRGLGFIDAGDFTCEEVPALQMRGLVHEAWRITASIREVLNGPAPLLSMASRASSGDVFQAVNREVGVERERPPNVHSRHHADLGPAALLEAFLAERPSLDWTAPDQASYAQDIEKAWARYKDWRNFQGGTREAEFRAIAARKGEVLESTLRVAMDGGHEHAMEGVKIALMERYRSSRGLAPDHPEPRVAFVHDLLRPEEAMELLCQLAEPLGVQVDYQIRDGNLLDSSHLPGPLTVKGARDLVREFSACLPGPWRPEFLESMDAPIPVDVYGLPPGG